MSMHDEQAAAAVWHERGNAVMGMDHWTIRLTVECDLTCVSVETVVVVVVLGRRFACPDELPRCCISSCLILHLILVACSGLGWLVGAAGLEIRR
ncbi:hypothetical protein GUJ93_ZPchr0012g20473 [Zizania palustris]|uniref:Uncharacterized protein n=1 Tax=Zizania palustris TaxID=103762 RepID=A0A8J5WJ46_ZIZPA|nr:hypothetical protein GUJ93_ZPchr0012g20473 [Zizania palustris]